MQTKPLLVFLAISLFNVSSGVAKTYFHDAAYFSLKEVAKAFKMDLRVGQAGDSAQMANKSHSIRFNRKHRYVILDGTRVYLGNGLKIKANKLFVSEIDFHKTLKPLIMTKSLVKRPNNKIHRIVIDPGHGGKDRGAINERFNIEEKTLSLDLAKRLKKILTEYGYHVILTRNKDELVALDNRSAKANRFQADLFVSIHFNSTAEKSTNVKGIETYAFTPYNQPSTSRSTLHHTDKVNYPANKNDRCNQLLAFKIQDCLRKQLGVKDLGVKRARFTVLKQLLCPGVLIENGFINNEEDLIKLKSKPYRETLARTIAQGILDYRKG